MARKGENTMRTGKRVDGPMGGEEEFFHFLGGERTLRRKEVASSERAAALVAKRAARTNFIIVIGKGIDLTKTNFMATA